MTTGQEGLTSVEREALRGLAESAWKAATEGGYLDQLNLMTADGLADDMISYDADIDKVKQILTRILESDNRILKDRDITVRLNELAPSSVNFVVRAWSLSGDLQNVYWDVLEQIKAALK